MGPQAGPQKLGSPDGNSTGVSNEHRHSSHGVRAASVQPEQRAGVACRPTPLRRILSPMSDNPLKRLIREIHRRSIWQVLGIYVVASWAVLSVVDTLGGALNLPDWFPAFALALLVIGLPIVLATAFVQEGGPGRDAGDVEVIEPDSPPRGTSGLFTWRKTFTGGVLAFALLGFVGTGWILFGGGTLGTSNTPGAPQLTTIAVLPFQNNSPDAENDYFADGVHEDILTHLSKISDLVVRPRSSVMRYQDAAARDLKQISEDLEVTAILEGSVRRVGSRIRVTVQLVDAATDANLWAETYDRDLEDMFLSRARSRDGWQQHCRPR